MDVEQRARELLGSEYRAAHSKDPSLNFCTGEFEVALRAVIAALTPPEGYVLVPVDLEQATGMWEAGIRAKNTAGTVESIYVAMLSARPEVPDGRG